MLQAFRKPYIALTLIFFLALFLRLSGITHGLGFHPDERHMVSVTLSLDTKTFEGLNPKSFAYGSIPYYANRFTAEFLKYTGIWRDAVSYDALYSVGRFICIVFGVLTVLLTYFLAKTVFQDTGASLLASLLLALNVLHLQLSRFFTSDVMLTFFTTLSLYGMVRVIQDRKFIWWLVSGLGIGLSVGTKFSGILLFVPLFFCFIVSIVKTGAPVKTLAALFFTVLFSVLVCFLSEPFAFLDFTTYWKQVKEQTDMARGAWEPPYTKQYAGTTPFLYPLEQMALYTMGIPVFLTVIGGIMLGLRNGLKPPVAILLIWVGALFFSTAGLLVKYPRYLLPLYPVVFVFAGCFLMHLVRWLRDERGFWEMGGKPG